MKNTNGWRGSFAIPMTPYDDAGRIDTEVLAAEIEFCVGCGVGGIAVPLMVSEFRNLSESERKLMIRIPVEAAAGRVPVVANCAAVNSHLAAEYAGFAREAGADAVIAMPPYVIRPDFESVRDYYRAISEEAGMPVWIQNAGVAALSAGDIARLCTEIEHVSWVKEEVPPSHRSIAALNAQNCTAVEGIMGGDGGRAMMIEHALGTRGVLHACQFCDLVQKAWELLDAGETGKAGDLYEVLLPGLYAEGLMGMAFAKEIMVRRGVFWNHRIRGQANPLSGPDMKAIDRIWNRIEPHLIWRKG